MSISPHCSASLPFRMTPRSLPVTSTTFPLGGMPMNSPVCAPRIRQRQATSSPSNQDPFHRRVPIARSIVHRLNEALEPLAVHGAFHTGVIDEILVDQVVDELDLALAKDLQVEAPDDLACVLHDSSFRP